VKIAAELLAEIVAHAQEIPKIECCGVVAVEADDGPVGTGTGTGTKRATRVYRAENIHASALKFEIDPIELLKLNNAIDDEGWEIGAIYHSHVRSAPYPSQTDIGFAASWPGVEWIIVGLASGERPDVRSYLIDGADVSEVELEDVPS
jgi:proteasome lid subunit RPN8/RPN11